MTRRDDLRSIFLIHNYKTQLGTLGFKILKKIRSSGENIFFIDDAKSATTWLQTVLNPDCDDPRWRKEPLSHLPDNNHTSLLSHHV